MADAGFSGNQASSLSKPLVKHTIRGTPMRRTFRGDLAAVVAYLRGAPDEREKFRTLEPEEMEEEYAHAGDMDDLDVLKKFHFTAPPTAGYDSDKPLETLLRFAGTGLDLVARRVDAWALLGLHVFVTLLFTWAHGTATGGLPDLPGWPKISIAYISVPSSIIIFVLTFYVNQTYARYLEQGGHVGGATGALSDLLLLLRVHLPDTNFEDASKVRWQLVKFMNAIPFLAFGGMQQGREVGADRWCWYFLKKESFLTSEQVEFLKPLMYKTGNGSLAFKEVILWLTRGIWAQVSNGHVDPKAAVTFQEKLGVLRGHLDALYGAKSGAIPFAYYHLVLFMVNVYLLLLSYAFIFVSPWWSIPGFVVIELAVIGMRELGSAMSNPFGIDCMDIPVYDRAYSFMKQSMVMVGLPIEYPGELPVLRLIPYKFAG